MTKYRSASRATEEAATQRSLAQTCRYRRWANRILDIFDIKANWREWDELVKCMEALEAEAKGTGDE